MGLFGSKGTKSSSSSGQTIRYLDELGSTVGAIKQGAGDYSKDAAISDVSGVLRTQAETAMRDVMPTIFQVDRNQGAYNSTSQQLLRENAEAQIIGQLANTQLQSIKDYAAIEQGNVNALSNAARAGTSTSQTSSSKGGGSGLLGLFADGGVVPEPGEKSAVSSILDFTKTSITDPAKADKQVMDVAMQALQPLLESSQFSDAYKKSVYDAQQQANSGSKSSSDPLSGMVDGMILDTVFGFFKDGGKVPDDSSAQQLLQSIQKLREGGNVRTGESDVKAGGKIRGPQTKDGEDNQLIAVGGGEGIIAADVMKVPGVEQLVQRLNEQFHKK